LCALVAAVAAFLLTFTIGQSHGAPAQPPQPLEQWLGEWRGTGTTSGAPANLRLRWERTLGGRFVRLTLVNEIGARPPLQRFEGLGLCWSGDEAGRLNGRWFDSEGAQHVLDAALGPDALIAEWGDGTTPRGRSTHRLLQPHVMEVIDEIRGRMARGTSSGVSGSRVPRAAE
jgi:hypothetical protein